MITDFRAFLGRGNRTLERKESKKLVFAYIFTWIPPLPSHAFRVPLAADIASSVASGLKLEKRVAALMQYSLRQNMHLRKEQTSLAGKWL